MIFLLYPVKYNKKISDLAIAQGIRKECCTPRGECMEKYTKYLLAG